MSIKSPKGNILFYCLVIFAHLFWFALGQKWGNFFNSDTPEYIYLAENIKHGHYYAFNFYLPLEDFKFTFRPPVYSLFLLGLYTFFGQNPLSVILLQNIISIGSIGLIRKLSFLILPDNSSSFLFTLFVIFFPAQMFFANMLVPDLLFQFFLVLYLYAAIRFIQIPQKQAGWKMACWLILAVLTKPAIYPFFFLHLFFCLGYSIKLRRRELFMSALLPVFAVILYCCWNRERTGLYHVSSVQAYNLLHWNTGGFISARYGVDSGSNFLQQVDDSAKKLTGLPAKYELFNAKAKGVIKADPVHYGLFHLKGGLRFFIDPGKNEMDLFHNGLVSLEHIQSKNFFSSYRDDGLKGAWNYIKSYPLLPILVTTVLFNILRIAGFLLFFRRKEIRWQVKLFILAFVAYFALLAGPVTNSRYFLGISLIMSVCAALGFEGIWNKRKSVSIQ